MRQHLERRQSTWILFILGIFFFLTSTIGAANPTIKTSPVGIWKTIDDVTNQPKAIVQIWEAPDHALLGRIVKIYPQPGRDQNELCVACTGEKHNQRIVGMIILEKLKQSKKNLNTWGHGRILDPKNGNIYRSTLQLMNDGQKLMVRGYIGIPLFGRSQTWLRVFNLA